MDKLIDVMFKNVSRSVIVLTGIYLPGFLTLFIIKYDMFKELDIIKLSVLSIITAFPSFAALFLIITLTYAIFALITKNDVKKYLADISIYAVGLNILVFALFLWKEKVADSYFIRDICRNTIGVGISFLFLFLIDKISVKIVLKVRQMNYKLLVLPFTKVYYKIKANIRKLKDKKDNLDKI